MKINLDSIYFGSLIPIVELDAILNGYRVDLQNNITLSKHSILSSQVAVDGIDQALQNIDKNWKTYASQYKYPAEKSYITYATKEIEDAKQYFLQVKNICALGCDTSKLSMNTLSLHVSHMSDVINKLRSYEIESAKYQRHELLYTYEQTKNRLTLLLTLTIGAILIISYMVFTSIQKDQKALELASKKLKIANKKLQNASYTDSLTNLFNRRYFNIVFEREINRAKREKKQVTFMMIDVDYFKQYNDTYGHLQGDEALKVVAKVLSSILKRAGDFVFRLGGEEFGALIIDTDSTESQRLANTICQALKDSQIPHSNSKVNEYLTLSIGLASCIADETLVEEDLIKKADTMLYEAKESGRDRYVFSEGLL